MKSFLIFTTVLLLPLVCYPNSDWDSWQNDSPYGRFYFDYDGNGTTTLIALNCSKLDNLKNLDQWYYYKGHIIGSYKNLHDNRFFIYHENSCEGSLYNNASDWEVAIKSKALHPLLWTRWYSQNWIFFDRMTSNFFGATMLLALFYLAIPLTVIAITFALLHKFTSWKWKDPNRSIMILVVMAGIVLIRWLLDYYPQSF